MRYPIISYLIGAVGLFVLIISWGQWFFKCPDTSQLFLGTMIAVNILAGAYVYAWMKFHDAWVEKMEDKFQGFLKYYTKQEFEEEQE